MLIMFLLFSVPQLSLFWQNQDVKTSRGRKGRRQILNMPSFSASEQTAGRIGFVTCYRTEWSILITEPPSCVL